ncbi:MAG: hypothetical protein FWG55_01810, partial [Candidatus Bathyarchaeota archaeon]|nr:hypothetical protein [Candidatus Termiticorpusculum sp.]
MREKISKNSKNKSRIGVSLIFLLMLLMTTFSAVFADYTQMPDRNTYTEVGISPKTIGLGQEA